MEVKKEICNQCPLSKKDIAGVYLGALRCSVCGCFITPKEFVKGNCPKFKTIEEMKQYKEENTNV